MSAIQKANIIGGNFQSPNGGPLSNGYLVFTLNHDSNIVSLNSQIVAGLTATLFLDVNGNLVSGQYLYTNDVITPAGSYYTVNAYDSNGIQVWSNPQIMNIQPYAATINIGSLTPVTPN
jgi:hypothetical protein